MKLLAKNELQQQKAFDRKVEVEEAMKLARKVDTLRRTASEEEARLTRFRDGTTSRVVEELAVLIAERDSAQAEVTKAKEELEQARIPLDEEWETVKIRTIALSKGEDNLTDAQVKLREVEKALLDREKAIEMEESRIEYAKKVTHDLLTDATREYENAKSIREGADRHVTQQKSALEQRERSVLSREANTESRETDSSNRAASLDARERELNARETRLMDREATLLRNINRNGKRIAGSK